MPWSLLNFGSPHSDSRTGRMSAQKDALKFSGFFGYLFTSDPLASLIFWGAA